MNETTATLSCRCGRKLILANGMVATELREDTKDQLALSQGWLYAGGEAECPACQEPPRTRDGRVPIDRSFLTPLPKQFTRLDCVGTDGGKATTETIHKTNPDET